MDGRVSAMEGKKRVMSARGSTLLRQRANRPRGDGRVRPRTCPGSRLTPELHWNLNNSALKTLSKAQVEQLYGLFKFYDSSAVGDTLPSICCSRFVEVLRDARLLGDGSADSAGESPKGLQVDAVERVFAQAVMGKMRVYLDADDQPALTFSLFCGALMHCAMLLNPLNRPEAALQEIVPILLESSVEGQRAPAANGLLSHLPSDGTMSLWTPEEAHSQPEEPLQDFRELATFQQVIANCTRDKALAELRKEKLERHYRIPDKIATSFHPDTIALISSKFRMFDAFDRGTLPRHEVFAFLSSLGTHLDLPAPYAILAKLSASTTLQTQADNGDSSSGELTLAQLLQVIEATRETTRNSTTAQFAAMKIRMDRAALAAKDKLLAKAPQVEAVVPDDSESVVDAQKTRHTSTRKHGTAGLRSRKSTVIQETANTTADTSSNAPQNSNPRGNSRMRASISDRKKPLLQRKSSTTSGKGDTAVAAVSDHHPSEGPQPTMESQFSATSARNNSAKEEKDDGETKALECLADMDNDIKLQHPSNGITVQVHEPPSSCNSKAIHIFLLLGGDHDGAICYAISLVFATKEIMEKEGVYYTAAPSETTRKTPVLPVQKRLANALLVLKRCVVARLKQGFELRPPGQLDIVDKMLQDLQRRQPHFSRPVAKVSRGTATAAQTREERGKVLTSPLRTTAPDRARTSLLRRHKSAPPSKPVHHPQFNLPSNYKNLFAAWEVSQSDNYAWIHDVNAASPLKLATTYSHPSFFRDTQLSPLRLPPRHNNQTT
ncbi:hypothetical protein PRNP1_004491 [Phytophthora ramorum]